MGECMRLLLAVNLLLLCWRMGMRGHFTARWYGLREAMFSVPRDFVANVIAILAARRAVTLYWRMLRSGDVVRSEEHTSDIQSLMRITFAAISLIKNTKKNYMRQQIY